MNRREGKDKREKRESGFGSGRILYGSIIAALVAAVAVFLVMLQLEKNALSDYEKGSIYVAVCRIPEGELITAQNSAQFFALKELDITCIPGTALHSPEQIEGLIAAAEIEEGVLLTEGMFTRLDTVLKELKEPVIAGFKAEDLYQVVGGVLRAGDRIHLYSVDDEGETVLVWENIFVQQVFDNAGAAIGCEDVSTAAQRMNVYLDRANVERFYRELACGSLRAVKICD